MYANQPMNILPNESKCGIRNVQFVMFSVYILNQNYSTLSSAVMPALMERMEEMQKKNVTEINEDK